MDLKNALTICLISFFCATLVVLIARALDNQAASRLEPQLAQIVEELRSLRGAGGSLAAGAAPEPVEAVENGLIVYYFHGDIRCPTCRWIEAQTHEIVTTDFSAPLQNGQLIWKVVNYDKPASTELAKQFDVQMSNVVLARVEGGQTRDFKRLDQVWALQGNESEFNEFVRSEISDMLGSDTAPENALRSGAAAPQVPEVDLPVPVESVADLPLPN